MLDLLALTRDTLDRIGLEPRSVSVIELNRSVAGRAAVALVVFIDERPDPAVFVKATTDAASATRLEAEHDTLRRLQEHGPPLVARAVPRPLHLGRHEDATVLAESIVPGRRMKNLPPGVYFSSGGFRAHLAAILAWLEAFHASGDALVAGGTASNDGDDDEPGRTVARFREGFERSAAVDALLDASVARLDGRALPRSPWHGDLCSANILVQPGGGIGVIDWEHPIERGWPLLDLVHCLSSIWCVRYRKGRAALAENFHRLFFGRHALRETLRDAVAAHVQRLGIAPTDILAWSALGWATYANRKRRMLDEGGDVAGSGDGRGDTTHWPLIMLDGDRCVNLELLAAHRRDYLWPENA